MTWLNRKVWCWTYQLEEAREQAQAERHLWRQAAACIGLAVLRGIGG